MPQRKPLDINNIPPDKNVVVARILVNYNHQPYNKHCSVSFSNNIMENLNDDGIVFAVLPVGVNKLTRLSCDGMNKDLYGLFLNVTEKFSYEMLYIGDITLNWENNSGMTLSEQASYHGYSNNSAATDFGSALGNYLIDRITENKNVQPYADRISYSISDNINQMIEKINVNYPNYRHAQLKKSIIKSRNLRNPVSKL